MFDRDIVARTRRTKQAGMLKHAGSFAYILFTGPVSMRAIVRTDTELFTSTVARRASYFDVIVNGNVFDVTNKGKFDALFGNNAVSASEPMIEGRVVRAGVPTISSSEPRRFYIAEIAEPGTGNRPGRLRYVTGYGDPPKSDKTITALGALGPLISAKLPYGTGNRYQPGTSGPASGNPEKARDKLVQRNNLTVTDAEARPPRLGKRSLPIMNANRHYWSGYSQMGWHRDRVMRPYVTGLSSQGFRTRYSLTVVTVRCRGIAAGMSSPPEKTRTSS